MSNIAIIGGGASACMCALNINANNKVTIFCKEEKLCKKILVTGNGRCNITNLNFKDNGYNQNLDKFFNVFSYLDTLNFFKNLGLETYADEEGRVYPISNTATSVQEIFEREILNKKNIQLKLNEHVTKIEKKNNLFIINQTYNFDKVVICTGSSDELFKTLNVNFKPFVPSLMALKTKENTKRLSGLKLSDVEITLITQDKEHKEFGEVLFKDSGISGICVFNLSAYLSRVNNFNAKVQIDLLPKVTQKNLVSMLQKRKALNVKNMIEFMQGLFHKEINKYLLKICEINEDILPLNLDNYFIEKLAKNIKKLEFNIYSFYENNQVKTGGIKLEDLSNTLEYKNCTNLYFAGEACDVDGICGGYNLQWAWTSGKIIGDNL